VRRADRPAAVDSGRRHGPQVASHLPKAEIEAHARAPAADHKAGTKRVIISNISTGYGSPQAPSMLAASQQASPAANTAVTTSTGQTLPAAAASPASAPSAPTNASDRFAPAALSFLASLQGAAAAATSVAAPLPTSGGATGSVATNAGQAGPARSGFHSHHMIAPWLGEGVPNIPNPRLRDRA
jgi:hypothetical protein